MYQAPTLTAREPSQLALSVQLLRMCLTRNQSLVLLLPPPEPAVVANQATCGTSLVLLMFALFAVTVVPAILAPLVPTKPELLAPEPAQLTLKLAPLVRPALLELSSKLPALPLPTLFVEPVLQLLTALILLFPARTPRTLNVPPVRLASTETPLVPLPVARFALTADPPSLAQPARGRLLFVPVQL